MQQWPSVIKSPSNHVASAIKFSAAIGLIQVIFLPILFTVMSITEFNMGYCWLSVYAVPQVVAASFVIGNEAGLIATQVKLKGIDAGAFNTIVGLFLKKKCRIIFK